MSLPSNLPYTIGSQKTKEWRACLKCRLLLSTDQFQASGCPNCPELRLHDRETEEMCRDYLTRRYLGMIGNFQPGGWVKRVARLDDRDGHLVKGSYAVRVEPEAEASARVKELAKKSGGAGIQGLDADSDEDGEGNLADLVDDEEEVPGGAAFGGQ